MTKRTIKAELVNIDVESLVDFIVRRICLLEYGLDGDLASEIRQRFGGDPVYVEGSTGEVKGIADFNVTITLKAHPKRKK